MRCDDVEQAAEVEGWRSDTTHQTVVGQQVDELNGWRVVVSLQVYVQITDDEQRLHERNKTIENVGWVGEGSRHGR